MKKQIGILCFSPTGSTKTICETIALGMDCNKPKIINLTHQKTRNEFLAKPELALDGLDHLIVGLPVHSGKLPLLAIDCLQAISTGSLKCSAIVVYGNRDFGVALYNMVVQLIQSGLTVVSAAAFIGKHSYSDVIPIATDRPDETDLKLAYIFGLNNLSKSSPIDLKDIPIQNDSISQSPKYPSIKPRFQSVACQQCGRCAAKCPIGILSAKSGEYKNRQSKNLCLGCMACVRCCPSEARINRVNPLVKLMMKQILKKATTRRQEPILI